jgi:hypothetical protein
MSIFHKQFLVQTKFSKFAKEVMNTYLIPFHIKIETVFPDSQLVRVPVLKSICLEIVRFETNFHRADSLVCTKPKS